jgi:hypothetical protein
MLPPNNIATWTSYPKPPPPTNPWKDQRPDLHRTYQKWYPPPSLGCSYVPVYPREQDWVVIQLRRRTHHPRGGRNRSQQRGESGQKT